jgi:hypothetical protein
MMYCIWHRKQCMYWPVRFKRLSYAKVHQLYYGESVRAFYSPRPLAVWSVPDPLS